MTSTVDHIRTGSATRRAVPSYPQIVRIMIEKADEARIDTIHRGLRIEIETVHDTYTDALAWAEKLT